MVHWASWGRWRTRPAGFIDPGFDLGAILELACFEFLPIESPSMPIGQLSLDRTRPVAMGYSGKNVGQSGPTPSRYHLKWDGASWG